MSVADQSLIIPFASNAASRVSIDALMLEQKPWRPYTGYLTKVGLVKALANRLYSEQYDNLVNCGMDGDQVVCIIYAYPYSPGLSYVLATSYGELSDRVIDEFEHEQLVNISLSDFVSLQYPPREIVSAEWVGDVWDDTGNIIVGPVPIINGLSIDLDRAVYGALRIRYLVVRHVYLLSLDRRIDAWQNYFSAVVYGVYSGGLKWLDIDPPPGAEDFAADAECGYGSGGSGSVTDDSGGASIPDDVWGDRIIKKDYCSQEIILDEVYGL